MRFARSPKSVRNSLSTANKPPPALAGCHVIEFVVLDRSVKFRGRSNLFVDGKELGPVPRLAITHDRHGEYLLVHCSRTWKVLGIAAYGNLRKAKLAAERCYPGISNKWLRSGISHSQIESYLKKIWKGKECSFCGRRPDQIDNIFAKRRVRICDICIRAFNLTLTSSPRSISN